MSSEGPVQINSEAIKTVEEKIVNIINNEYITYIQNGGNSGGGSTLTPETITALADVNIKGTCKLADNKVLNASGNEITFPSTTATLATTSDIPTDYVKTTTNQTIGGVKTFSSAPKLTTNSLTTSSGNTVSIPNSTSTMATTSTSQTLSNKTLDSSTKLASGNTIKTYSGDTITFPSSTATLATSSDISTINSSISSLSSDVSTLSSRVDGANPALVFDTQAQMNTWLSNPSNTATLKTGQNLYIRQMDVPDYWWDGSSALNLETEKVDLTNYVSKTGNEILTNKTLTTPDIAAIKNGNYTLTVPSKDGTLATMADIPGSVDTTGFATQTGTETLTNKTLSSPTITDPTIQIGNNTLTLPTSGTIATTSDIPSLTSYATLTGTETLTNKTLTSPDIATIKNSSHTLTVPSKDGILATTSDIPTNYVKTSDAQTIAGVKTFSSAPKLNTNTITTSGNKTITFPNSADATLATMSDLSNYVSLSGAQTVAGVKTFSAAPKLNTNTITTSGGYTITFPNTANKTLATTDDVASASGGGSESDENNLATQILYLSIRLEAALTYLSEKPYYPRIKTICDEVCATAMINKAR